MGCQSKIPILISVGECKRGSGRVIPITGGTFERPKIKGEVLPVLRKEYGKKKPITPFLWFFNQGDKTNNRV